MTSPLSDLVLERRKTELSAQLSFLLQRDNYSVFSDDMKTCFKKVSKRVKVKKNVYFIVLALGSS